MECSWFISNKTRQCAM